MDKLEGSFIRWRKGEINTIALAAEVDRFARGPARRRLEERYNTRGIEHMMVARAIVSGVLRTEEVPTEVLHALGTAIEFYKQGLAGRTISIDEED
jgi:hypothetical protein